MQAVTSKASVALQGKSVPNSNHTSAHTSFLTSSNPQLPMKTTSKKGEHAESKESSQISAAQKKNLKKKKNRSILRQNALTSANSTQAFQGLSKAQPAKAQWSKSRPQSSFRQESEPRLLRPGEQALGRKKHSQQLFVSYDPNKENVRPALLGAAKKSFNMVGPQLHRPEEMLRSYEHIVTSGDLLREIQNHRLGRQ